ncbi:MAG: primosomal protein N' [Clostridium sp.]
MINCYANVIIDISHEKVDRTFQYKIPEHLSELIFVGVQVLVPFGSGNTLRKGYVVGLSNTSEFDLNKTKEIAGVVTEGMSVQSQLIQLAWWMRRTYGATMNQALKTVLPVKQKMKPKEKKSIHCLLEREELEAAIQEAEKKSYKARARILEAFRASSVIPFEMAENQLRITSTSLKPLVDKKYIEVVSREVYRNPVKMTEHTGKTALLNAEQQAATQHFIEDYKNKIRKTYLLYGITGSGKTEVYMELMEHVIAEGKQVILLIPEIALTYQTVIRFYKRFGDQISIINSRLSAGERYDQWERAMKGEISIMIGPRSALFTPFENLGLIIIDEEHEGAYKSETMPRYHARDTAEERARLSGASLVLGSATPSLESYTKAVSGEYELLTLENRAVKDSRLAVVEVADLREELKSGNKTIFSGRLKELIEDRLNKKEQIMLFMNRRGYSNFVSCRSCGEAVKCPHCDVSLTLHKNGRLVCHYCGYSVPLMKQCPSCGSPYIANFGVGTQQLEMMTKKAFPGASVLRMDADTTAKKGSHEEILAAFAGHEADILIGTQMIVKGHDFPAVTLVGIMAADLSLNTPDYRCAERTFELLTQAAGRAGRGKQEGNVVIQTYNPEHYSIETAVRQDYKAFYKQEMMYRKMMNYPPVCRMEAVLFAAASEAKLNYCADLCARHAELLGNEAQIVGPVKAPIYKVNDIYRKILYIKTTNCAILDKIRGIIESLTAGDENFRNVSIQYDIS